jgi:hypothetical protein
VGVNVNIDPSCFGRCFGRNCEPLPFSESEADAVCNVLEKISNGCGGAMGAKLAHKLNNNLRGQGKGINVRCDANSNRLNGNHDCGYANLNSNTISLDLAIADPGVCGGTPQPEVTMIHEMVHAFAGLGEVQAAGCQAACYGVNFPQPWGNPNNCGIPCLDPPLPDGTPCNNSDCKVASCQSQQCVSTSQPIVCPQGQICQDGGCQQPPPPPQ